MQSQMFIVILLKRFVPKTRCPASVLMKAGAQWPTPALIEERIVEDQRPGRFTVDLKVCDRTRY
jgi:hypothetical protein